jgi:hypothetical protein
MAERAGPPVATEQERTLGISGWLELAADMGHPWEGRAVWLLSNRFPVRRVTRWAWAERGVRLGWMYVTRAVADGWSDCCGRGR